MDLSVLSTSLPLALPESLRALAELGFRCVDLVACQERPAADCEALAETGLRVRCMSLGRDLRDGARLDDPEAPGQARALAQVSAQLTDAARLGAEFAYVVPCATRASLDAFTAACAELATAAAKRMVRLCVEPMPGTALPSAAATLDWLQTPGLERVGLLLDVGHCLISREDPAQLVRRAGAVLAYVHLDDNDGQGDLHWPLLTGQLTGVVLRDVFVALREIAFRGGVALELNPRLPDPLANLRSSLAIAREAETVRA
jgi:sugar phosphate isomerase/epimerase